MYFTLTWHIPIQSLVTRNQIKHISKNTMQHHRFHWGSRAFPEHPESPPLRSLRRVQVLQPDRLAEGSWCGPPQGSARPQATSDHPDLYPKNIQKSFGEPGSCMLASRFTATPNKPQIQTWIIFKIITFLHSHTNGVQELWRHTSTIIFQAKDLDEPSSKANLENVKTGLRIHQRILDQKEYGALQYQICIVAFLLGSG